MPAGRLNKRVAFQRAVKVADGGGGSTTTWETFLTVWGGFFPERTRERLEAGRLESAVAGRLTVRSSDDTRALTTAHRVVIDGYAHQIHAIVNPDQRDKYLDLTVERGVAT
jgi:SPP1 family predicted phage head-tail adaptor